MKKPVSCSDVADITKDIVRKYKSIKHTGQIVFTLDMNSGGIAGYHANIGLDLKRKIEEKKQSGKIKDIP